jgi:hypothetical protein
MCVQKLGINLKHFSHFSLLERETFELFSLQKITQNREFVLFWKTSRLEKFTFVH